MIPVDLKKDLTHIAGKMDREFKALQKKYPQYYFEAQIIRQNLGPNNFYRMEIRAMDPNVIISPKMGEA